MPHVTIKWTDSFNKHVTATPRTGLLILEKKKGGKDPVYIPAAEVEQVNSHCICLQFSSIARNNYGELD